MKQITLFVQALCAIDISTTEIQINSVQIGSTIQHHEWLRNMDPHEEYYRDAGCM